MVESTTTLENELVQIEVPYYIRGHFQQKSSKSIKHPLTASQRNLRSFWTQRAAWSTSSAPKTTRSPTKRYLLRMQSCCPTKTS